MRLGLVWGLIEVTQEVHMDQTPLEAGEAEEESALTVCKNCSHLVPKTMLCLWCGHPILFKMPKRKEKS
jgi:rRNA maturation endonuclease Nob1